VPDVAGIPVHHHTKLVVNSLTSIQPVRQQMTNAEEGIFNWLGQHRNIKSSDLAGISDFG